MIIIRNATISCKYKRTQMKFPLKINKRPDLLASSPENKSELKVEELHAVHEVLSLTRFMKSAGKASLYLKIVTIS